MLEQSSSESPVLIVCDEPLFRDYVSSVLSGIVGVRTADNGKAAWNLVLEGLTPSQIWLEWMTLDRELFLGRLRETEALAPVPLVILIAFMGQARIPHASAVIERPFTPEQLREVATRFVR